MTEKFKVKTNRRTKGCQIVKDNFSEVKIFQVKLDKLEEFEKLIAIVAEEQKQQKGCIDINCGYSVC